MSSELKDGEKSGLQTTLGIKDLLDEYSKYRKTVSTNILLLVVGGILLATFSRSPKWTMKDPFGFLQLEGPKVDVTGVSSGFMPIFGPILLVIFVVRFRGSVSDAISLRSRILQRIASPAQNLNGIPELEILKIPMRSSEVEERRLGTRLTTVLNVFVICVTPMVCYFVLVFDFLMLDFDQDIKKGYELLYTFHGWNGFWPSGHRGGSSGLPPVYPIWQPWLYCLGSLLLAYLLADVVRMVSDVDWKDMSVSRFTNWVRSGTSSPQ